MPNLLHRSLLEVSQTLYHLEHSLVEVAEIVIAEFLVVNEVPLAACILVAPSIALAGEVNPFGMSELVAHKVEVATVDGCCRDEANHLVESDATMNHEVLVALLEVPIHVGIYQTEDNGLVAYKCLVVALAVADGLLVGTAVLHLPEYRTRFPILVLQFLDGLYPVVGGIHRHAIVEAISAILILGSQSWHTTHLLGDSDSIGINLMDEQVGKSEIADGIVVLMSVEVVGISTEGLTESVTVIEH